jgi:hypothetical protein
MIAANVEFLRSNGLSVEDGWRAEEGGRYPEISFFPKFPVDRWRAVCFSAAFGEVTCPDVATRYAGVRRHKPLPDRFQSISAHLPN